MSARAHFTPEQIARSRPAPLPNPLTTQRVALPEVVALLRDLPKLATPPGDGTRARYDGLTAELRAGQCLARAIELGAFQSPRWTRWLLDTKRSDPRTPYFRDAMDWLRRYGSEVGVIVPKNTSYLPADVINAGCPALADLIAAEATAIAGRDDSQGAPEAKRPPKKHGIRRSTDWYASNIVPPLKQNRNSTIAAVAEKIGVDKSTLCRQLNKPDSIVLKLWIDIAGHEPPERARRNPKRSSRMAGERVRQEYQEDGG